MYWECFYVYKPKTGFILALSNIQTDHISVISWFLMAQQAQILTALIFDFYNLDCPPWEDEVI